MANQTTGNDLFFGANQNEELHGLWDEGLVVAIRDTADYDQLAESLESSVVQSVSPTLGDYHSWAEKWAADSVRQAQRAYQGITFGSATIADRRLRIVVQLPDDYIDKKRPLAAAQLAKAGVHLAQLLNAIQWRQ